MRLAQSIGETKVEQFLYVKHFGYRYWPRTRKLGIHQSDQSRALHGRIIGEQCVQSSPTTMSRFMATITAIDIQSE